MTTICERCKQGRIDRVYWPCPNPKCPAHRVDEIMDPLHGVWRAKLYVGITDSYWFWERGRS